MERIIVLFITVLSIVNARQDCDVKGISASCNKPFKIGLDDGEKTLLVKLHNELRNQVALGQVKDGRPGPQPSASNMVIMKWDEELADRAQAWANQCEFRHDECRNSATDKFSVGQNIAMSTSSSMKDYTDDLTSHISSWFNEVKKFDKGNVKSYKFDQGTAHYTQLAWASTNALGCGYISYPDNNWNKNYLVCNYGPAGNKIGSDMYVIGEPVKKCPDGLSKNSKYKGICS